MNEEFEKLWEQIEANFDWKKVYKVMKLLDWVWSMNGEMGIPHIDTIKKNARGIAYTAFERGTTCTTAGFYASCDEDGLELKFILEDWFADVE
jgi:hypothetical protein